MFENILTKENVTFKDLEEIAFKIACEFANEILKNMLEEYDKKIMDDRDTARYRHKGKEKTTVYYQKVIQNMHENIQKKQKKYKGIKEEKRKNKRSIYI